MKIIKKKSNIERKNWKKRKKVVTLKLLIVTYQIFWDCREYLVHMDSRQVCTFFPTMYTSHLGAERPLGDSLSGVGRSGHLPYCHLPARLHVDQCGLAPPSLDQQTVGERQKKIEG